MNIKTSLINAMLIVVLQAGVAITAAADVDVRVCDKTPTPAPILSIKHFNCSLPNSVYQSVNRPYVDQNGNRFIKAVPGFRLTSCDSAGTCAHQGEFMGNAPAGLYGVTTGWYLGTDTSGGVVAYKEGTGPGYGGKHYEAQAMKKPSSLVDVSKLEVVCMATAVFNCSINGEDIEDQDLPKYLPLVDKKDVKKSGGNCDSAPLCYDKNMMLLGLNKDLF